MLPNRTLDLNIAPGVPWPQPTNPPSSPPTPTTLLATGGTQPGSKVTIAPAAPSASAQRWVLAAPIPGTPSDLQGTFQILNGELMLLDQQGPADVGTASGIGGAANFWRLLPYEIDFPRPDSYTLHLYDVMVQGVNSGLVLTRAETGDGVTVEAATTQKENPLLFERQLWRLVVAP